MVDDQDIKCMSNVLELYYHNLHKADEIWQKKDEKEEKLKNLLGAKGISYGSIGNGCSCSFPCNSNEKNLILQIVGYQKEAEEYERNALIYDVVNNINYRLQHISDRNKDVTYYVFQEKQSQEFIMKEFNLKNKNYIYKLINKAIKAMLEVKI